MHRPEVGRHYKLVRDFEIHDPDTGTLKHLIRKGEVVKVRKIEEEKDLIYLEGISVPAFFRAFQMHIVPAEE
ncbi:hypothetical protein [Symbiobacterium thermophilum]|mgnify:CR=1 FL=1|uniref:Uncharacterized protein n=2 Tax=Symbiobacterium thermophilum TaxID=2734 RepID=Q67LD0_SYMTH|nr:hypothetical protein [Symbiobacterium thermophilum]MBY6274833.1 hypothetical protein [Symbiobacterium thermophilum]OTA41326.1 MAG: hypothetical protein A6D92_07695 [Symbiobacterium thermophilum]BAD41516.1 hypothetical protein STH2531 [Symbiobacterium thermophilum IAM 14863]